MTKHNIYIRKENKKAIAHFSALEGVNLTPGFRSIEEGCGCCSYTYEVLFVEGMNLSASAFSNYLKRNNLKLF